MCEPVCSCVSLGVHVRTGSNGKGDGLCGGVGCLADLGAGRGEGKKESQHFMIIFANYILKDINLSLFHTYLNNLGHFTLHPPPNGFYLGSQIACLLGCLFPPLLSTFRDIWTNHIPASVKCNSLSAKSLNLLQNLMAPFVVPSCFVTQPLQ